MNTTQKGNNFEDKVHALLPKLIKDSKIPVNHDSCGFFRTKRYYSPDREGDIQFENVVEVYSVQNNKVDTKQPFISIIFECKNYNSRVGVDEVEEFSSKLQQIKGFRTKGYMVTTHGFQKGAQSLARNLGIGLIRVMPEDQVQFIMYHMTPRLMEEISREFPKRTLLGLTDQLYISKNETTYYADSGYCFYSLEQMVNHYLEAAFKEGQYG